jgi:hypothetical protein
MDKELWKNPYVIAGAGVMFLLIIVLSRSGNSGAFATAASAGIASQATATGANVQLAAISSVVSKAQIAANTATALTNSNNVTGIIAAQFNTFDNLINNVFALNKVAEQVTGAVTINKQTNDATLKLAPILAKRDVQIAGIQANAATTVAGIQGDTATNLGLMKLGSSVIGGISSLF